jgi:hypothetical protein
MTVRHELHSPPKLGIFPMEDMIDDADVELIPKVFSDSTFFLERAQFLQILTSILVFLAFLCVHLSAACHPPTVFSHRETFIPVEPFLGVTSYNVEVSITALRPFHRFVAVNCSLVSNSSILERDFEILLTQRTTRVLNSNPILVDPDENISGVVHFVPGVNLSSSLRVVSSVIADLDELRLRVIAQANYRGIDGFQFRWDFFNPTADSYSKNCELVLSLLMCYITAVFVNYLKFDDEFWTQVALLGVGLSGAISSNPIGHFLSTDSELRITDHFLMGTFIALFRMFLLMELELLRTRKSAPNHILIGIMALFFLVYLAIDVSANYDRQNVILHTDIDVTEILEMERAVIFMDALYVEVSIIYLIVAVVMNGGVNLRRLTLIGVIIVATGAATLFRHTYCLLMKVGVFSVGPQIAFTGVHITFAALAIFFLRCYDESEYTSLTPKDEPAIFVVEPGLKDQSVDINIEDSEE